MKNREITTEQWIETWTKEYEQARIDVAAIDFVKSQSVQNRSAIKLDDEHVLQIMEWLDDRTHVVSPIVVNLVGAKYHIIDGNHRAWATKEMGRGQIDAYVLQIDQDTFEGMVLAANARNAKGLTYRERIELAIQAQRRFGTTVAAAQVLMKPDTLQQEIRVQEGRHKVEEVLRVKADAWPKKKLEALNRLDHDQIKAIGSDVLTPATAAEVLQTVNNILTVPASQRHEQAVRESGRLEQVAQEKKQPRTRQRGMTTNKARTSLIAVTAFLRANPAALNDREFMEALKSMWEVVKSGQAQHAA